MLRKFDTTENISKLINTNINIIKSYGKTTYLLNELSNSNKFYIIFIYKNKNELRNLNDSNYSENVLIKYTSFKNKEEIEIYSFKPSKSNIYAINGYLIWSIGKIILNNSIYLNNTNYTLFLYNSNLFNDISEVENIKNLSTIYNYTNYIFDEENNLVSFNISQSNLPQPGIYFVVVKAEVLTKNKDIELLCSKAISLKLSFSLNEEIIFSYSSYSEQSSTNIISWISSFSNSKDKPYDSSNNNEKINTDENDDYSNSEEHNNKKILIIILIILTIILLILLTIYLLYIYIKRKRIIKNNIKNETINIKIDNNNQNKNEINDTNNTEDKSKNSKFEKNFFSIKENEK
jgi:hypothetical protein